MISDVDLDAAEPAQDRRVRRSRAALVRATVELVSERGTANVAASEIADAADVSRRLVYQHFGDRDGLLLEAGLDLARRELLPLLENGSRTTDAREPALAVLRHFAQHRVFYRALLTGPCAFEVDRGLISLLLPINRHGVRLFYGDRLDPQALEDLATFVTGGGSAVITAWVVDGADPLDPEAFTDRLLRTLSLVIPTMVPPTGSADPEGPR